MVGFTIVILLYCSKFILFCTVWSFIHVLALSLTFSCFLLSLYRNHQPGRRLWRIHKGGIDNVWATGWCERLKELMSQTLWWDKFCLKTNPAQQGTKVKSPSAQTSATGGGGRAGGYSSLFWYKDQTMAVSAGKEKLLPKGPPSPKAHKLFINLRNLGARPKEGQGW